MEEEALRKLIQKAYDSGCKAGAAQARIDHERILESDLRSRSRCVRRNRIVWLSVVLLVGWFPAVTQCAGWW